MLQRGSVDCLGVDEGVVAMIYNNFSYQDRSYPMRQILPPGLSLWIMLLEVGVKIFCVINPLACTQTFYPKHGCVVSKGISAILLMLTIRCRSTSQYCDKC